MASRGGKRELVTDSGAVPDLIAADIKAAQRPAGIMVPPSSYNDSMYGATGEWRVDERGPTLVQLPAFKFSIRKDSGRGTRSLTLTVKDIDSRVKIFSTAGVLHAHAMSYRSDYYRVANELVHRSDRVSAYSQDWERLKRGIETIAAAFNYDKSDIQTDYFDVGFYFDVRLDPALASGNQALAERTISALEVAFADTWEKMVAEAANEQALETSYAENHPGEKVQTTRRDLLEMSARRALEAVKAGTYKIPFNAGRRGWAQMHSRKGLIEYYRREKKLKAGMLMAYVGAEPGVPVLKESPGIGPTEHEWFVTKLTGGRGGKYTSQELVVRGVADSIEDGVNAAEAAMGFEPEKI